MPEKEMVGENQVPLVIHVNHILLSVFFRMLRCTSTISSFTIQMDSLRTSLTFHISNNFKGAISESMGVLHGEGYDYEECLEQSIELPLLEHFVQGK